MYTFEILTFLPLFIKIVNVIYIAIYNNDNINATVFEEFLLKFSLSPVVEKINLTGPSTLLAATPTQLNDDIYCYDVSKTAKCPFLRHELQKFSTTSDISRECMHWIVPF